MSPDEALARIRRYDGRLKAFVRVFDRPLGDGDGPVFAIKDLFDVEGVPTGGGARVPLADDPAAHAVVVQRLLAGGWQATASSSRVSDSFSRLCSEPPSESPPLNCIESGAFPTPLF